MAITVSGAQFIRIRSDTRLVIAGIPDEDVAVAYSVVSIVMVLGWALSLRLFGTRDYKVIGTGTLEYKRVTNATFAFFGVFAILAFALQAPIGRSYLLVALPAGWVLLILSRWLWRKWLIGRRRRGRLLSHALLVGDRTSSLHVAEQIQRDPGCGLEIVGAITERGTTSHGLTADIPVIGGWDHLLSHVDRARADTVIITGNHTLTPRQLRELGWGLEERKASLIVAPALTDVAGPRIHSTPVAGLPLIHVDYPELTGIDRFLKRAFDVFGALVLILLASPIMVAVAIAVKSTSRGPLFYGQERIGRHRVPFKMWKFRSMIIGADDQLKGLLDAQGTSDRPLFKVANDPRITPVGKFIRRHSLDELPQFFNVLAGSMSLVGPRPQVAAEVALYEDGAHRRLFMRPGISGLWQVSGRSDLDWDDAIRLDLYYVENWSLTGDLVILWRTLRAVTAKDGAY
ncbi:polyprenyl glycosylphosphotransferase [Microbacterium sp. B35-30]|nr:polyprenyl glycosylphosphotransferase [Microbacterium sp. B35-30]